MITNKKLTFASANLFNFIAPPNAFYDFENIYDSDAWNAKCQWTRNQLLTLDADIIGLQEVFSIEEARNLFAQMGYPYVATVDTPHVESDYIYSQPVVALASRYPIHHLQAVTPPVSIGEGYSAVVPNFSRSPIFAIVEVPDIGEVAVYVCHLKSQRATESVSEEHTHQLVGQWLSSQQRGWEALMLRVFIEQQYQRKPMPTVLMGDMNQTLTSNITGLLVQQTVSSNTFSLQDSWDIYAQSNPEQQRQATHYHFAQGNILDYILLSPEFQPDSPYSLADVTDYQVIDKHLINPSFEQDKQASDHAFIAVTVQFVL
ncbi:endonuclease [Vibrio ponticus]|uniref:Endonuclease n=1 Tax=Vibrio ponticus TaxID=265668 RepID=A0ABX3FKY9_9VIBR|nr:endonuclease/exonuclease/phosphatase family protein [Vibrio ponticus]OLQ94440.1 endonuclease [Vibrio ponticus]